MVWLAGGLLAQEPTIRTDVPLVVVPVNVTDPQGRFVYGLDSTDFFVRDNGIARAVRADDPDAIHAPLDLVVLVQTSDISDSALLKIKKVGLTIQNKNRRGERFGGARDVRR